MGKSFTNPIGAVTNIGTGGLAGYEPGKGFTWGVTTGAINKATGGELSKIGEGLKDVVLGSETPATPNEVIDLASPTGRALQEAALGMYGSELGRDTSTIAANQIAQQEAQARQNVMDQQTKARELIAQRGLGGTSMGINALTAGQRNLGQQLGTIRAQQPGIEQQLRQQQLGFASQGINQILGEQGQSKILKTGQQAQGRSGGLLGAALPIAGQVLGGMAGSGAFNKPLGLGQ